VHGVPAVQEVQNPPTQNSLVAQEVPSAASPVRTQVVSPVLHDVVPV
jgi:hypothetical protein